MTVRLVLTPAEVAEMIGVSDVTVRRLVRTGYLPRIPGVRTVLIPAYAVDVYLRGEYDDPTDGTGEGAGYGRPDEDAEG